MYTLLIVLYRTVSVIAHFTFFRKGKDEIIRARYNCEMKYSEKDLTRMQMYKIERGQRHT